MKRYLLPLMLIMTAIFSASASDTSSDKEIDRIFDEFSTVKDADYVNLNPFMMKMASIAASFSDSEGGRIARKIKAVKVLCLDDSPREYRTKLAKRMSSMRLEGYDELVRSNEDGQRVRVLARIKDDYISRLIIACSDDNDCSLISITGKFSKDDLEDVVKESTRKAGKHDGGQ